MSHPPPTGEVMTGYLVDVLARIDKFGHVCQGVFGVGEGDIEYVYTVGLTPRFGIEFLIAGLPIPMTSGLLNEFVYALPPGWRPDSGVFVDVGANYEFMLRPMTEAAPVNVARALYQNVVAWQLLWPDADNLYPPLGAGGPPQCVAGSIF